MDAAAIEPGPSAPAPPSGLQDDDASLASSPLAPETLAPDALREAVGPPRRIRRRSGRDDADATRRDAPRPSPRSPRMIAALAIALVAAVGVTALVLLGRVNADRYFLTCTTTQALAEQGRAFPPWGKVPLTGVEWTPIALPANAPCTSAQLDDARALAGAYLALLLERANTTLEAPGFAEALAADPRGGASLDALAAQLEQALLLARAPERGDPRKQVERMIGDVQYWRATLRLREAAAGLADAARQFDAAASARPLHATDASAWAELIRRAGDDLRAGPGGVPAGFPAAPAGDRPSAPAGVALPVAPEAPAADSAAPAPSAPAAGLPVGGVLL